MVQVTSSAELMVIMYWHKDCVYCQEMIADFNFMHSRGIPVVAINTRDTATEVAKYNNSNAVQYLTLIGGRLPEGHRAVPLVEIYFRGKLAKQLIGEQTSDTIGEAVLSIPGIGVQE